MKQTARIRRPFRQPSIRWICCWFLLGSWTNRCCDSFRSPTAKHRNTHYAASSWSNEVVDAAAALTQDSSPLLGVKSLGIDYGLSRTGVAVTVGYNPQPLAILDSDNRTLFDEILQFAKMEQVSRVVVGLPLHKNGTIAEQTNLTVAFASELAQRLLPFVGDQVLLHLWDERYTSKEAAARAHAKDPHRALYGTLDADAACIILEHYYQDGGVGAHTVEIPEDVRTELLDKWNERKRQDDTTKQALLDEREARIQRRKDAIARDQQAAASSSDQETRKKKKKKRR